MAAVLLVAGCAVGSPQGGLASRPVLHTTADALPSAEDSRPESSIETANERGGFSRKKLSPGLKEAGGRPSTFGEDEPLGDWGDGWLGWPDGVGDGRSGSVPMSLDYFQGFLVRAGVPADALPSDGRILSPEQALQVLPYLLATEPTLGDFGSRRMAAHLLLEVATFHPGETLEGLTRLPGAVRELVQNAPEYWEAFRYKPHGEQVRAISRLTTNVLLVVGTSGAGAAKAASWGGKLGHIAVPVFSLTGGGELALRLVAVPGRAVAVAGSALSATYVLHMANMGGREPEGNEPAVEQGVKTGARGGPGSGKRFPEAVKESAEQQAGGRCVFCGRQTTREPGPAQRNTDHAVPKSRGGSNTLDNAQNTCRTCNLDKGSKTTEEFLGGR